MSERLSFLLKGAAPKVTVPESTTVTTTRQGTGQRKTMNRLKLLDDTMHEYMLTSRRTTQIPSFAMLTKEGTEYPEHTDERWCQWDHYPFSWRPSGIPSKRYTIAGKPHFICYRWFCSLECARSFFKAHLLRDPSFRHAIKYLEEMHRLTLQHLNQPYTPLQDALDWNLLKLVGSGTMEIDDFRSPWTTRYINTPSFIMHRGIEMYLKWDEETTAATKSSSGLSRIVKRRTKALIAQQTE